MLLLLLCNTVQLVISYHMGANIMCEYSREEWVNGLTRMGTDSLDKLRSKLPELRGELRDPARFQEVYAFAFSWAREVRRRAVCVKTRKVLLLPAAVTCYLDWALYMICLCLQLGSARLSR
jgi:hypothetical protein